MADKTTDSTEEVIEDESTEEVDGETQDETDGDEESTDDTEGQEETADESDESDNDEGEPAFEKRFTQLKGDTPEEYLKNLEDTYAKSSTEAVRLNRQVKELEARLNQFTAAVATNPDLAAKLKEGEGVQGVATDAPVSPAVAWAESEMQRTFKKEYDEFAEQHPEITTDPALEDELNDTLAAVRDIVWKKDKRQVGMGEALNMAWKLLDKDDSSDKVAAAAKASAAQSKTGTSQKSESKPKFSESQISVAMDMMNVDRATAIKSLSEYATT